jgi:uncharacterized protein YukE
VAGSWEELAEAAEGVAVTARVEARALEERRAALSRYALVWWQGEAAERYRRRVLERSNELAALAAELDRLATVADDLAEGARSQAAVQSAPAPGELP